MLPNMLKASISLVWQTLSLYWNSTKLSIYREEFKYAFNGFKVHSSLFGLVHWYNTINFKKNES